MPPGIRKRLPHASGARYHAGHKNGASPAYVQNEDQPLQYHNQNTVLKWDEKTTNMRDPVIDVPLTVLANRGKKQRTQDTI